MTDIDNFKEDYTLTNISGIQQTANFRQSKSSKHFKNPPQPHMCIKASTDKGEEIFINVLSWTRIVEPKDISDPIPLYGGMRILSSKSSKCTSLVYAVMANPEVLKFSGRHCKDQVERNAIVELMCEFVEAMNQDIKLNRNAFILQDRDIAGELKDIWNAVQAQREKEREDLLLKQKQQRQMSSMGHLFTNGDETIISNNKIIDNEVKDVDITDETSAITLDNDYENDNEVNGSDFTERSDDTDVTSQSKKEKSLFLHNGGIFPKIKLNKFSKNKSKEKKDCKNSSEEFKNDFDTNLEKDIGKMDLNQLENKINSKKKPSEVWC